MSVNLLHVKDAIIRHGAKVISSGSYATVYTHPFDDTKVIKITRKPDPAYMAYVDVAEENSGNPWFPYIYSSRFNDNGEGIVVMEALEPIDEDDEEHCEVVESIDWMAVGNCFETRHPIVGAAYDLHKWFYECTWILEDWKSDIHPGNVMLRDDGHYVIVDPVYA